jgi:transcriptional regulator with XRE-family HTH domain
MQQETAATVRAFMRERGCGQQELAKNAGVSQATVSRVLTQVSQRAGKGRRRLFKYIESEYWRQSGSGAADVTNAFQRIWDGTPEHALAVAKVIDALEGLRPLKEPAA